jgi:HEPN domain-containing protein
MLKQALQSLRHGLQHLEAGSEADRAFAFLHIDQAAELLLKEKVRELKESIYAGPNRTINLFEAKKILDRRNVDVPEWSAIEIVHKHRNLIQHSGVNPDQDTTYIYLIDAIPFFERFLKDEFNISLRRWLAPEYIPKSSASPEEKLLSAARENLENRPRIAIMAAATAVELAARPLLGRPGAHPVPMTRNFRKLETLGLLERNDVSQFQKLWAFRNRAVHAAKDPSKSEARFAVQTAERLVDALRDAGKKSQ